MANFQIWPVEKLQEFIRFTGATPHGNEHDALLIQAVQIHSTDSGLVQQFEGPGQQPLHSTPAAMSHGAPYPPFGGGPSAPLADNPYASNRGPGYPTPAGAPSYPPASGPAYPPAGGHSTPYGHASQTAYPDVDFSGGGGGAPGPAQPSPYPPYAAGGGGPHTSSTAPFPSHNAPGFPGGHPAPHASAPLPYPAASAPEQRPSPYPGAPAPGQGPPHGASPYPTPSAPGPSASHAPSPYPVPGAPTHMPTQAQSPYPVPGAPEHKPAHAPSPYPMPGAPAHAPSPYPMPGAPDHKPAHAPSPYPVAAAPAHKPANAGAPYPVPAAPNHAPRQHQPSHGGTPSQPSRGRKKALLIGCNYPGTRAELRGCCTDVQHVEYLLRSRFGFTDITVLRDDGENRDRAAQPTRNNILRQMDTLVRGAQPGDSLFFHFSGHGSQKRDHSGDERDGMNETICPTDFERSGQIIDDELNKHLVNPLPAGVRLHALLDACHSGTGMDLRHVTKLDKRSGHIRWKDEGATRKYKGTNGGFAVQFGACKDSQTAADTASLSGGTHTGAATFLFIQACERLFKHQQPLTYSAIMKQMLQQIEEFNKKNGRASGGGGLGGGLAGIAAGVIMGAMTGHGLAGAMGGAMSALAGGGIGGQTPQMSASEPFNLETQMVL